MEEFAKSPEGAVDKPRNQPTFRFAGVVLRSEDTAQDALRNLTKASLRKHLAFSVLIGAGLALILLGLEKPLADNYFLLYRIPDPYPYMSHGLPWFVLFFYSGWAMYWGIVDVMDEQPGAERRWLFWWRRRSSESAPMKQKSIGTGASLLLALLARRLYEAAPSGVQHVVGLVMLIACGAVALYFGLTFFTVIAYSLFGGGIYGFIKMLRQSWP